MFSGLGADEHAFHFLDIQGATIVHVHWIQPMKNETIQHYAQRLSVGVTKSDPIFIGLSFGGIIAQEVAQWVKPAKIILLGSVKSRKELPWYIRFAGTTGLWRIAAVPQRNPGWLVSTVIGWFFGTTTKRDSRLLRGFLRAADPLFMSWATKQACLWKGTKSVCPIIHIHGDKDRIFPIRSVHTDHIITGGGHLMTVNQAAEISQLINLEIKK